jgi:hypothetical protein
LSVGVAGLATTRCGSSRRLGALGSGDGDRATARHCDQFGDHVAADLLFYLMSAMSTVNARPTTPSIKTISSFIEEGPMLDMALDQQTRLRKGIETAISKEKQRRNGIKSSTKPKSKSSKKS